jgi:predicted transposase YbfD/YdcC
MDIKTIKDQAVLEVFNEYFKRVKDPRQQPKVKHLLNEVLFITVLAVIAGADDFNEIAEYAEKKQTWLKSFLKLPGGLPSHDTFNRVICMIDAREFEHSFIDWMHDIRSALPGLPGDDVISMDGKTVCNSEDNAGNKKAIHMVSAFASKYGLVLGQQKCNEKSNEITAIPALLKMLLVEGSIITIDAMGCQKNIAKTIRSKKADYILAVKANQGNLSKEIIDMFEKVKKPEFASFIHSVDTQVDKDHGRIESRQCVTIENLGWLFEIQQWEDARSIIKITANVLRKGKETVEERYYISSLPGNAALMNRAVRKHWYIENKLHWVLDVLFKEDYCRVRTGNGAENLTTIRKIALNTFKMDQTQPCSLKIKRKRAGWDDNYALMIISKMKV